MAWASPRTWTTGEVLTAAMFNAVRDDFFETEVAKVTASGDTPYGNGAHSLTPLPIGTNGYFLKSDGSIPGWATNDDIAIIRQGTVITSWADSNVSKTVWQGSTPNPTGVNWLFRGMVNFTNVDLKSTDVMHAGWTNFRDGTGIRLHADGNKINTKGVDVKASGDMANTVSPFMWLFSVIATGWVDFSFLSGSGGSVQVGDPPGYIEGFQIA